MKLRPIMLALPLLTAAAEASLGAAQDATQQPAGQIEEVIVIAEANRTAATVATRLPLEAMATPYTITAIGGDVIEESGARSLADAMRYTGTVGGTDNFGNAGEFFSSRGFQLANSRNYFRDGLRYRKFGQVPLYDIERIEILRGPASILYGALEPGGVVNIVSRQPQADEFAGRALLRAGDFGFQQGIFDITGPVSETLAFRVQGLLEDADSFRDIVSNRSEGLTATFDWRASPDTLVTVRASHFKDRRTADRGTVMAYADGGAFATSTGRTFDFADVPRDRFLGEEFGNNRFSDTNIAVSIRHDLSPSWQLRGDIVSADQEEDRVYIWAIPTDQVVESDGLLQRQIGDWNATLEGNLGRLELAGELTTGAIQHKILLGAEYERFENDRTNQRFEFAPINIYAPDYLARRPEPGRQTVNGPFGSLLETQGLYLQDVMELGDHFVVLVGVRGDWVKDEDTLNNRERFDTSSWTPQLGIVWRPTPNISPYVSYTRSFVPQSGVDRFGDAFDPQEGEQLEAGIKLQLQAIRGLLTAAIFELDRDNLTVVDPVDPNFNRLAGLQRSRGLELSLDTAPIPGMRLSLSYNHLISATFVDDNRFAGNDIPNAPDHTLGAFLRYEVPAFSGLSVHGGATHVSDRSGTANASFRLPSYTLLDFGARYRISSHVEVSANVRNLLNERYFLGSINSTTIGVGMPRALMAGVNLSW